MYRFIKQCQLKQKIILYIDSERSFDPNYAKKFKIDLDSLLICEPPNGSSVKEILDFYIERDLVDVIIIDSLASLVSEKECLNGKGDYLQQAHMIGLLLNNLMSTLQYKNIITVCLNQIRVDQKTGDVKIPFNKIMAYYSSIRIALSKMGSIKKNRILLGYKTEAKIFKNNYNRLETVNFNLEI